MPRGGRREGSGAKSTWKHGKTKPIRVPEALSDEVIRIARILDELGTVDVSRRVIDLSGVAILQSRNGPVVRLADLVRIGYTIKPERLTYLLRQQPGRSTSVDEMLREALGDYE